MLSFSEDEIERYTRPLCSETQLQRKLENFRAVEASFAARQETCSGLPFQIHLEPSGECNLHCPICPRGSGKIARRGLLSLQAFLDALQPLQETLCNIIISGFGEPLLNPLTPQMISHASQNGISTFMNTNGTVLAQHAAALLDARLSLINISLDGAVSRSVHAYSTEHAFDDVVTGVQTLRQKKEKGRYAQPIIWGQFIVSEETIDETKRLEEWALDIGIERVKFKRMHHTMPGAVRREELFAGKDLTRISRGTNLRSTEKLGWSATDCSHPWDSLFISCLGEFGLCSFDPHQVMTLGRPQDGFTALWNSEKLRQVRRWHAGKTAEIGEPCSRCNRLPGYFMPVEE
jgi:MoaA/NifB/PqqE/SkfB family radical SAM enzyme